MKTSTTLILIMFVGLPILTLWYLSKQTPTLPREFYDEQLFV